MIDPRRVAAFWGGHVDTSGRKWVLDDEVTIRFARKLYLFDEYLADVDLYEDVEGALKDFLRERIGRCAATTVKSEYHRLKKCLSLLPVILSLRFLRNGSLLFEAYEALRESGLSVSQVSHYLATLRRWFLWAAERDYGFSPEEATIYALAVVKGAPRGQAVLRRDSNHGPLSDAETDRVEAAFWAAKHAGSFDAREICAAMLMFYLGCNPENLRRLRNSDLVRPSPRSRNYVLRLPRIKKGHADKRAEFKERDLTPAIGRLVAEVVDANRRALAPADGPLFSSLEAGGHGCRPGKNFFWGTLSGMAVELGLTTDDGIPLRLSPRRLRYSFASRCVANGTTPEELMELLDHSDLSTLMVYFDGRLGAVTRLDQVLGDALRPLAATYLDPSPTPWAPRQSVDVSAAPLACLDCVRFRPNHPAALRSLGAELSAGVSSLTARGVIEQCEDLSRRSKRAFDSASACEMSATPFGEAPEVRKARADLKKGARR